MKTDHPWRTRSYSQKFAIYLNSLPAPERLQILRAEQQYLAAREAPFSIAQRAARDFYEIMHPYGYHEELLDLA
jgi:hypothetical protein